jgi:hypothetical protein
MALKQIVLAAALAAAAVPALASTEEDWAAFRKEVGDACNKASEDLFDASVAIIDPFGSENYGLALVRGKARGMDVQIAVICVFDKKTKAVEIGTEIFVGQ